MPTLRLKNLETGMVTASDVFDQSGRMLFPAHTEISAKHIKVMKTWGVNEIEIVGDADEQDTLGPHTPIVDPAVMAAAEERTQMLFRFNTNEDDPLVAELKRLCLQRLLSQLSEGETV
ncbi:hypothetical protein [Desulfurispira natronophila]|uniref:Uncharacterized protein n=1 Tax=Desulfurispira natronophila TaxID=682562 RepID=A0A7W7Y466_9BACT|nr:hypothetical protein [Desulfurispira natronophila]MBB5021507.1 hypothetical protein [Desulfurispira natronophila]